MPEEDLVLRHLARPPDDDPDIHRLLGLLASAVQSTRAALSLELAGRTLRYEVGGEGPLGSSLQIPMRSAVAATLELGVDASPSSEIVALAGFALQGILKRRRLTRQAALLRGALDLTSSAVLLFDPTGDIVYANPPADRLLSRQIEDGLVIEQPADQRQPLFAFLCSQLEHISNGSASEWQGIVALSDGSMLSCEVTVARTDGSPEACGGLAVLEAINALPKNCLSAFAACYSLSPREEEVVRLALEGLPTVHIADRLGISRHTVRDHFKHLYRKTGTSSRGELLALLPAAATIASVNGEA